jgi:hypothetical protein
VHGSVSYSKNEPFDAIKWFWENIDPQGVFVKAIFEMEKLKLVTLICQAKKAAAPLVLPLL